MTTDTESARLNAAAKLLKAEDDDKLNRIGRAYSLAANTDLGFKTAVGASFPSESVGQKPHGDEGEDPTLETLVEALAEEMGVDPDDLRAALAELTDEAPSSGQKADLDVDVGELADAALARAERERLRKEVDAATNDLGELKGRPPDEAIDDRGQPKDLSRPLTDREAERILEEQVDPVAADDADEAASTGDVDPAIDEAASGEGW